MRKIVLITLCLYALLTMATLNYSTKETKETTKKMAIKPFESNPFVVIELFTSQGCSSCPPADEILNKMKSQTLSGLRGLSKKTIFFL